MNDIFPNFPIFDNILIYEYIRYALYVCYLELTAAIKADNIIYEL